MRNIGEPDKYASTVNIYVSGYDYTQEKALYDNYLVYKIQNKIQGSNQYLLWRSQTKRYLGLKYPKKLSKAGIQSLKSKLQRPFNSNHKSKRLNEMSNWMCNEGATQ